MYERTGGIVSTNEKKYVGIYKKNRNQLTCWPISRVSSGQPLLLRRYCKVVNLEKKTGKNL